MPGYVFRQPSDRLQAIEDHLTARINSATVLSSPMTTTGLRQAISAVLGPSADGRAIDALVDLVRVDHVSAGTLLFRAGDPAKAMGIVVSGRLRVGFLDARPATVTAEVGPGSVVGEMGLLGDGFRTADVWAARDSEVAWLDESTLQVACASAPTLGLSIARFISARSTRHRRTLPPAQVAVVGFGSASRNGSAVDATRQALVDALVSMTDPNSILAVTDSASSVAASRKADRLVVVCAADDDPDILRELIVSLTDDPVGQRYELMLVQPPWSGDPIRTDRWLATDLFSAHHHVRRGSAVDLARASRRILGRGIGLVFGGGGARGLAHLGVAQVLHERGVPVDFIGGTSMGAIMGAILSRLGPGEETDKLITSALREARIERDFAVPKISILRGRALKSALESMFANRYAEDLWTDWFCTSTNVSHQRLDIHDRGPLIPRLLATSAVPGLFPPIVDEHGVFHLDGGLLDNLPARPMRERGAARIIAVDVGARSIDANSSATPRITESLHFSIGLSSAQQRIATNAYVDLLISPEVQQFGLTSFADAPEIIAAGRRSAETAVDAGLDAFVGFGI
jgi:NTE family protein